jgi:rhodanese-related sulfurtransferase
MKFTLIAALALFSTLVLAKGKTGDTPALMVAGLCCATALAADSIVAKKAVTEFNKGDAVLLDVRENNEVERGRVKGALVFPKSKIGGAEWKDFVASLNKEKMIYTYCAKGGRADAVAKELRKKGFRAENAGGLDDLKKEGAVTQ